MNPIERIIATLKAFRIAHPPSGAGRGWGPLASVPFLSTTSGWDQGGVSVDPSSSAIVQATVLWLGRAFPEAPLRVQQRDRKGQLSPLPDHPLTQLVAVPNPFYSGVLLWQATIADWILSGNAYWGKVRSEDGRVTELWWLPARTVEPVGSDSANGPFIDHYAYRPGGWSQELRIDPADIVHFRYGMDPRDPRRGLSPLAALLREIYVDEEAQRFTAAILSNLGVPGVVISPDNELSEEGARQTKEKFRETFGGSRRGDVLVTRGKTAVSVLSFSPQQMNLRDLRRLPEERVTAVLGIPAVVVGLGAGLDRSTFANFEEARSAAYESNVIPTQRLLGAEIATQLLPDFGDEKQFVVDFDLGQVRVLQPDQDALWARLNVGVAGGWVMPNEARAQVGLEPLPDGDVVYVAANLIPTDPAALLPPEPAAAPVLPPTPLRALPPPEGEQPPSEQASFDGGETKAASSARYAAGIARIRSRRTPPLERQISRLLAKQRDAVVAAVSRGEKAFDWRDLFDPAAATDALTRILVRAYAAILGDVVPLTEAALGVDAQPGPATVAEYLRQAGTNIGGISEVTRLAIVEALQESVRLGEGVPQTAARISDLAAFSPSRARTISRTEVGSSTSLASVHSFRASGIVTGVRVLDGTDFDDACRAANGQLWTLEEAAAHPLQHPNCTRAFSPEVGRAEAVA